MYAIVKAGGKQYRVEKGDTLVVDRMPDSEGAKVTLEPLLFRSEDAVFEGADLAKVKVEATVQSHMRGKKIYIQKFKPKRGYKRRTGHRSELTTLEITDIKMGSSRSKAAAKPDAETSSASNATPASKASASGTSAAEAPAKKPAAKKPAAKASGTAAAKKPAAKKPAVKKPPVKKDDDGS